jgi:hypothetical protein
LPEAAKFATDLSRLDYIECFSQAVLIVAIDEQTNLEKGHGHNDEIQDQELCPLSVIEEE